MTQHIGQDSLELSETAEFGGVLFDGSEDKSRAGDVHCVCV